MRWLGIALTLAIAPGAHADARFDCPDTSILKYEEALFETIASIESASDNFAVAPYANIERAYASMSNVSIGILEAMRDHTSNRGCQNRLNEVLLTLLPYRDRLFQELVERDYAKPRYAR